MSSMIKKSPDNLVETIVVIFLLIPIGIYYLLKWIIKGIVYIVLAIRSDSAYQKHQYTDLAQVDSLDGVAFEHFIAGLLRKHGYNNVRVTKASGDFGVDIFAKKDKKLWAFQCKCYQGNLGIKPVQEIYSGLHKYKADVAVVVTNSFFTNAAKELANDLSVVLWDRATLANLIGENGEYNNISDQEEPLTFSTKTKTKRTMDLEANQLTANIYVIGQDIPPGTYDFYCVFGGGSISKYIGKDTTLGNTNFFQWVGSKCEYESEHCVGVICKEGEYLHIQGNVVVEIKKSQKVQINL